jgi:DNA-binding transcriptional MerR regulator
MAEITPERTALDTGLLFTDGLPQHDDSVGYRGAIAARAAGISYRQLDYWARTSLVVPTVRDASGSGSQRLYGFRDILKLKLVKRLLDAGVTLQQVRVAIEQLQAEGVYDLAQITLMSDGSSVYLCTSNDEVIDLLSRGQGVFGIAVGKVVREVESSLIEMSTEQIDPNDEVTLRRIRKIG